MYNNGALTSALFPFLATMADATAQPNKMSGNAAGFVFGSAMVPAQTGVALDAASAADQPAADAMGSAYLWRALAPIPTGTGFPPPPILPHHYLSVNPVRSPALVLPTQVSYPPRPISRSRLSRPRAPLAMVAPPVALVTRAARSASSRLAMRPCVRRNGVAAAAAPPMSSPSMHKARWAGG